MHRQQLLERLQEGLRCRLVLGPQPRVQFQQPVLGIGVARLLQCDNALAMGFFSVRLRQVPLHVPTLVDCTALMHELLAEARPQRLDQPAAAIRHEEDPPGERQAATLQVPEQRLADLVILRGALPEPQGHLLAAQVHTQRDEERLAAPVDRVEEQRARRALRQGTFWERRQLRGHQAHELARDRGG